MSLVTLGFGIVAVTAPLAVFDFLVMIIGLIFLFIGILTFGFGLSVPSGKAKLNMLSSGLISIVIGLLAVLSPYVATIAIGYLIALWLVANGLLTFAFAVSIEWEKHRICTGILGTISFLLGLYLFMNPSIGTAFLTLVLGIFFIAYGILSLITSLFFWKT
ncbi:MAG: DUF308 domain-containing protein [Methanospirillum sp.]|uniref:HdeD family acid-resistance protein n=1 Tax=Methanospirillum sp. TaxID=45200 RepID=UPI0023763CC4|nr:DUF308 domain-containing protein [Methanospirillum sp.]MDD1727735.1 DUF308 domain-containing protein [Methanospirillum sp.]